jgi:hypothetical protein
MITEQQKEVPFLSWDTYEITKAMADGMRDEDSALTEDQAWSDASADGMLDYEWDFITAELTEKMLEFNPAKKRWVARVKNFGWDSRSGSMDPFDVDDGEKLLQKVLPNTECKFYIFADDDSCSFRINNYHHDSPYGSEWYYIRLEKDDGSDTE